MTTQIAINGLGRIGRCVLRALAEQNRSDIRVVAANDLAPADHVAHLLKYDSVHGRFAGDVSCDQNQLLHAGNQTVRLSSCRSPEDLDWQDVDIVFECTGHFNERAKAARHLANGSKQILVSAPVSDADRTVVFGVNHLEIESTDIVVSNASCTTNCLAPVAQVLDAAFGIETGYVTTVHSYTGDQPSHDRDHSDLYRARAAGLSMVPTSTGAARAISQVLPKLEGRLEGSAIRVPTANVSLIDFCFMPQRSTDVETVNKVLQSATTGPLKGVLGFEAAPLVSSDFNHNSFSSVFAPAQTAVTRDGMIRVLCWYDNEWGFSNRMIDTGAYLASLMQQANQPICVNS